MLNGTVKIVKALTWGQIKKQYFKDWRRHGDTSPFLVHFRIASHGSVTYENCHPFPLEDGGALIHNGMIPWYSDRTKSDTKQLAETVSGFPGGWDDTPVVDVLENAIGKGNKVCVLWPDARFLIMNEREGFWRENVWFSNYSCNVRTPYVKPANPTEAESGTTGGAHNSPLVDDGLYDPLHRKKWNMTTKRWGLPDKPTGANDAEFGPWGGSLQLPLVSASHRDKNGFLVTTKKDDIDTPRRTQLESELEEMLDEEETRLEHERFLSTLQTTRQPLSLVTRAGGGFFCGDCGEDLSTPWARTHHTKSVCEEIEQSPKMQVKEQPSNRVVSRRAFKGLGGRTIVGYPGI